MGISVRLEKQETCLLIAFSPTLHSTAKNGFPSRKATKSTSRLWLSPNIFVVDRLFCHVLTFSCIRKPHFNVAAEKLRRAPNSPSRLFVSCCLSFSVPFFKASIPLLSTIATPLLDQLFEFFRVVI